MSGTDVNSVRRVVASEGEEVRRDAKQVLISGIALTVPFFLTFLVLSWVLNAVVNALSPLVSLLIALGIVRGLSVLVIQALAITIVVGVVVIVGVAAQHGPKTNLSERIDILMEDIPGIGSIYTSVNRMSDVLLEGDTESFREVKLVEFPREGNFVIAFLTADTAEELEQAAEAMDLVTVFVPLAPNPVMGGHLIHLPRERVRDLDLSVEEAMEAVMTTGITVDANTDDTPGGDSDAAT